MRERIVDLLLGNFTWVYKNVANMFDIEIINNAFIFFLLVLLLCRCCCSCFRFFFFVICFKILVMRLFHMVVCARCAYALKLLAEMHLHLHSWVFSNAWPNQLTEEEKKEWVERMLILHYKRTATWIWQRKPTYQCECCARCYMIWIPKKCTCQVIWMWWQRIDRIWVKQFSLATVAQYIM